MTAPYAIPSREERDRLILDVFADPPPPHCPEHPGSSGRGAARKKACPACRTLATWRLRMNKRFRRRNLILADDIVYATPRPPDCPDRHPDPWARDDCQPCQRIETWRKKFHFQAPTNTTDWTRVRDHIRYLRDAGMTLRDIWRQAECSEGTFTGLLARPPIRPAPVLDQVAVRILDLEPPEPAVSDQRVSTTGTRRRVQAACLNGHSLAAQATHYGCHIRTLRGWLTNATMSAGFAATVAAGYPQLIARPGTDYTTIEHAVTQLWLAARYYNATNIDDPDYDPLAILKNPAPVVRCLQALAWMGFGPEQVAPVAGETPAEISEWMAGTAVPAYAVHIAADTMEQMSGEFGKTGELGPDTQLARTARESGWASPLAWYGIDITNPASKPLFDLPQSISRNTMPLYSQVIQGIMGITGADTMLRSEKTDCVRILHARGLSDDAVGRWLRWPAKAPGQAVQHFRKTHKIGRGYATAAQKSAGDPGSPDQEPGMTHDRTPLVIRCTGRHVNPITNKPRGRECGTVFQSAEPPPCDTDLIERARSAGWRISPPSADGTVVAGCPRCAAPTKTKKSTPTAEE